MDLVSLAALGVIATGVASMPQKVIYTAIQGADRDFVLKNGLYHFTSEKGFEAIQRDKFIKPSNLGIGAKTYLFPGIPDLSILRENIAERADCFEFYAIKLMPTPEQLSKFRIRALDDKAVTCKGGCDLTEINYEAVELVMDMDENKKLFIREKTKEEKNKPYEPREEIREALKPVPKPIQIARNLLTSVPPVLKRLAHNIIHPKETLNVLIPPKQKVLLGTAENTHHDINDTITKGKVEELTFDKRYTVDLSKAPTIKRDEQSSLSTEPKQLEAQNDDMEL